jgi:hypothetical protein
MKTIIECNQDECLDCLVFIDKCSLARLFICFPGPMNSCKVLLMYRLIAKLNYSIAHLLKQLYIISHLKQGTQKAVAFMRKILDLH